MSRSTDLAPPPGALALFSGFTRMSLCGFGGVLPWARRSIVEQHRWMSERDFGEMLAVAQVLPGPNICNLAVMFGWRCARLRGAAAALLGLLLAPLLLLLGLAAVYGHFSGLAEVRSAVAGMQAVTAGMIVATGIRMARSTARGTRALVVGGAAFVAIAVLHWPLAPVVAVLAPIGLALEWRASQAGKGMES